MKLYLAGPMRGHPNWNFPAFEEARNRLRAEGHMVFCPAANAIAMGYVPTDDLSTVDRAHAEHIIQMDLACIYAADAIALLPGWESSKGVTVELALAQFLEMPVYDARTMQLLEIDTRPWSKDTR